MERDATPKISVRAERDRRKLSREALAFVTGLSSSTIRNVERFGLLTPQSAERIARIFGCEPGELVP